MSVYSKLMTVQADLKAPKGRRNTFGNYNYRSAEDILEAVKPHLSAVGATLRLLDEVVVIGSRYYIKATAVFTDCETGEETFTTALAREDESKKGMDGAQITGTASSYARKYALNGLFDIDDTKDPDTDENRKERDSRAKKAETAARPIICQDCGNPITEVQNRDGSTSTPEMLAEYSKRMFKKVLCADCCRTASKERAKKDDEHQAKKEW